MAAEIARRNSLDTEQLLHPIRIMAGQIVNSSLVTFVLMLMVFFHIVLLGIEINISATSNELVSIPLWFSNVNLAIVICFVLELVLRFVHLGCSGFWYGPDRGWNCFDLGIVLVMLVDLVIDFLSRQYAQLNDVQILQQLRFARTMRSIRIVRVFRYMPALRTLSISILSTMASLFWTLALLVLLFYSFGSMLTVIVVEHCRFVVINEGSECPEELTKHWSSVQQSMLTLFMAISQGMDWGIILNSLIGVSETAVVLLLLYVVITIFAVLNVVTGVFCNTAIESASADKDVAAVRQVQLKNHQVATLKNIFSEIDRNNLHKLSFEDVCKGMDTPALAGFLESIGIRTDDVWTLFMLLDSDETGLIDLDEFVSGCMQLHGPAKSMQMAKMSHENKLTRQAVKDLSKDFAACMTMLIQVRKRT